MERIPIPSWKSIVFHAPSRFQDGAGTMRLSIRFNGDMDAVPLQLNFSDNRLYLTGMFPARNPAFHCPVRWVKRALARCSTLWRPPTFRHVAADRISTARSALRPAEGAHEPLSCGWFKGMAKATATQSGYRYSFSLSWTIKSVRSRAHAGPCMAKANCVAKQSWIRSE